MLRVVQFWIDHGVTIFRVDNPHTKPIELLGVADRRGATRNPEAIFLAEAFTVPAMCTNSPGSDFTQSYTYFTWRTGKQELTDYGVELAERSDYMRPNFFVNTPDILHASLQFGGPGMFAIRAVLAATLSPTWGVYSGFELFEHLAVKPGSEEYQDSEKYQLRPRDYQAALTQGRSLEPLITRLNEIRRAASGAAALRPSFHGISNDSLLCYSRRDETSGDTVIVVVCLGPAFPAVGRDRPGHAGPRPGLERRRRGHRRAVRRGLPLGPAQRRRAGPAWRRGAHPGVRNQ